MNRDDAKLSSSVNFNPPILQSFITSILVLFL
jgi:hypothetical protein